MVAIKSNRVSGYRYPPHETISMSFVETPAHYSLSYENLLGDYLWRNNMIENVKNFLQDEEGQSLVEYGVTLGALAAVSYIAVVQLGDKTADLYAWMANHLPGGEGDEAGVDQLVRREAEGLVQLSNSAAGATFDVSQNVNEARGNLNFGLGTSSNFEEQVVD